MDFILNDFHRDTPNDVLIDDVKRVAKVIGKSTVTIADYEQFGKFHPSTLQRRFGSWFKILEKCDLSPSRSNINISNEELFKNIAEVWTNLGRQPKYSEMKSPLSKYSAGTYEKRFDGWRKALEAFIIYINKGEIDHCASVEKSVKTESVQRDKSVVHKTRREISDRLRFQILARDGFTCKKCGRSPIKEMGVQLHVDHIIPWSKGGETVPDNLETKCEKCNLGKGNAFNV